jgi:hypothetical protein
VVIFGLLCLMLNATSAENWVKTGTAVIYRITCKIFPAEFS